MSKQNFWIVEVRNNKLRDQDFTELDLYCGELSGAKEVCVLYCREKRIKFGVDLSWLEAVDPNGPVFYTHVHDLVSFRIRR